MTILLAILTFFIRFVVGLLASALFFGAIAVTLKAFQK